VIIVEAVITKEAGVHAKGLYIFSIGCWGWYSLCIGTRTKPYALRIPISQGVHPRLRESSGSWAHMNRRFRELRSWKIPRVMGSSYVSVQGQHIARLGRLGEGLRIFYDVKFGQEGITEGVGTY
jgi:hypothetical protein